MFSNDAWLAALVAVLSIVIAYILARRQSTADALAGWQRSIDKGLDDRPTHDQQRTRLTALRGELLERAEHDRQACAALCGQKCAELERRLEHLESQLDALRAERA